MTLQAKVTSLEDLESFRASLICYLSKARPVVEEVCEEVRRTRVWLQTDRQSHWQNAVRLRTRELEEARQQWLSAKLSSSLQMPTTAQQWEVNRAQNALREAEDKLRRLRKWSREFENLTDPLTKQLEQLHTFLATDLPRAAAYLAQVIATLEAYADLAPSLPASAPAPNAAKDEGALPPTPASPPPGLDAPGS